jgi:hypothetical protein
MDYTPVHVLEAEVTPQREYPKQALTAYAQFSNVVPPEYGAGYEIEFSRQWRANVSVRHADGFSARIEAKYTW